MKFACFHPKTCPEIRSVCRSGQLVRLQRLSCLARAIPRAKFARSLRTYRASFAHLSRVLCAPIARPSRTYRALFAHLLRGYWWVLALRSASDRVGFRLAARLGAGGLGRGDHSTEGKPPCYTGPGHRLDSRCQEWIARNRVQRRAAGVTLLQAACTRQLLGRRTGSSQEEGS